MDFFGSRLHVLADDCTGGKGSGLGDVANEALKHFWPCCESSVPIRDVPGALSGVTEGARGQADCGLLDPSRVSAPDSEPDYM